MRKPVTRTASRRDFLAAAGRGIAVSSVAAGFPAIVPSSVFGASAPSNRINIGAIGNGRISRGHDLPGLWKHAAARIMAVCDVDSRRAEDARTLVNGHYTKTTGKPYDGVRVYGDYRELLANDDVDAVVISTPDHWHTLIAIDAVQARKDVYLQKPASLTIAEGRLLSDARASQRPDLSDRQPAALVAAVPLRRGAGAQRAHRPPADRGSGSTRRSVGRGRAEHAGAEEPGLRPLARVDARGVLHREARASADRVRPSGMAALRAVRRRDDHRLGRASSRHRPLGHGRGVHGSAGSVGLGRIPDERAVGRPRSIQD